MSDAPPVPLHCFAHAGAGISAFHGWSVGLGDGVPPVPHLLPGRERRRREPRVTGREALLADLLDGFRSPAGPYALYGHSLGALVAYTLARALHEAGLPTPALLAVGACPPPDAASALSDACGDSAERLRDMLDAVGAWPGGRGPRRPVAAHGPAGAARRPGPRERPARHRPPTGDRRSVPSTGTGRRGRGTTRWHHPRWWPAGTAGRQDR